VVELTTGSLANYFSVLGIVSVHFSGMVMGMTMLYVWSWQNKSAMLLLLLVLAVIVAAVVAEQVRDSLLPVHTRHAAVSK